MQVISRNKKLFAVIMATLILSTGLIQAGLYFFNSHVERQSVNKEVVGLSTEKIKAADTPTQSSSTAEMIAPIQSQLDALQKGDVLEAYQKPSSRDFLESTSFENFKVFVLRNPILSQFEYYAYQAHSMQGNKGKVEVVLNTENEAVPVEYYLHQEYGGGDWKIQYMQIIAEGGPAPQTATSEQMQSTLRDMMQTLKKKAYGDFYLHFIASDVQKATSEEEFERFFTENPIFYNYHFYNLKEPYIENQRALVTLEMTNEEGLTQVEISLRVENNAWKVTGIHIEKSAEKTPPREDSSVQGFKTRDLMTVIHAFLASLHKGNMAVAYQKYTSDYFQQANTLEQFKEFVAKHPELLQEVPSSFEKLMFNLNIATLAGKLYLNNSTYLPIEFDLILENDKWKILHIYTYPVLQEKSPLEKEPKIDLSRSVTIDKIIVGTEVNNEGSILDPTDKLHVKTEDIYLNLFIQNGIPGAVVSVVLRHVPSGSEMAPIAAALTESGNNRLSFIFSPPPKGWPKGPYQVRVSTLNKEFKTFGFTIE